MGTEVLRPQYLLAERLHDYPASSQHQPRYFLVNGNWQNNHLNFNVINNNNNISNYGYQNPAVLQKKRPLQQEMENPKTFPSSDDSKVASKHTQNNTNQNNEFSKGKFTILRRGESLDFLNERIKKGHSKRREMSQTQLCPDTYAGSAFSSSPSPSDLPLPTFFKKHQSFDDSATRDLRRLLRID